MSSCINATPEEWRKELECLPTLEETKGLIPSIFLAHGQPLLIYPDSMDISSSRMSSVADVQGPKGSLATFLRDLGPALLEKYRPKAVVVLSAHWETSGEILVSDYGVENPLLYDFFGFPPELYQSKFVSSGDSVISNRIVDLLKASNINARLFNKLEKRGEDGRGSSYPGVGLDHGVFVPFKLMFGDESPIPIIQVSIDASLSPITEWNLGQALSPLRSEGILIIAGGLTIHTFQDFAAFSPKTAKKIYTDFERAIIDAVEVKDAEERKKALIALVMEPGFRPAHPREEHFVPLYVAAGASNDVGSARVLGGMHGAKTVIFGV